MDKCNNHTTEFKPDARQQKLIDEAMKRHHEAQQSGRFAPDRLVRKWSSEVGIKFEIEIPQRKKSQE